MIQPCFTRKLEYSFRLGKVRTMSKKVLVVEDEAILLETLTYNLTHQGYDVSQATAGYQALEMARHEQPDLIVLDVMLPGIDGFEVCRILRQESNVPILMLTARDDVIDKVVGLEMGADDYMTKPFSMRELLARVKAMMRRERLIREEYDAEEGEKEPPAGKKRELLAFGNLVIDPARREARLDDQPLRLKPKEYDLLLFLVRNQGIALSRDLILERVWGWEHQAGSRTVDVHVHWLRAKIETNPAEAQRIVTVRGMGYRFEG
jgi:DNA-binding response OmpR family regulator